MPLVSVIIPAYNSGHFLDEAIESVIAQTFSDWECIVVDDGSTEDLSRVEKMDPRVRLVRQPNRGTSAARNHGMMISAGEFIAFLDHDDLWLPTKLETHTKALGPDINVGLSHTAFELVDSGGALLGPGWASPTEDYYAMLACGTPFPTMAMIRRSCIAAAGMFDPFLPMVQDYDFFLRVAYFSGVRFSASCEARYRVHPGNASRRYMQVYEEVVGVARKHAAAAKLRGDGKALDAARRLESSRRGVAGVMAYDAARAAVRERALFSASRHLLRSAAWSPRYTLAALLKYAGNRRNRPVGGI